MAKQIEARNLRGARHENLIDAVPLSTPWTMFIEPTNACNYKCKYCPTGDHALLKQVGRKNKLMDVSLFCTLVDDMKAFPKRLKMVNLYKDGESLLHPHFTDMARYLRDADVTEQIWVKTNGSLLSPRYNERLVNCGLDMIGVSVQHVNAAGYYNIAGVKMDYDAYRANVLDLYAVSRNSNTKVSIKIADTGLSQDEIKQFYDDFGEMCDFITVEGLHGWSASEIKDWKLGTDNSFDGTPRTPKIACPLVLYMITVSANGDVSICNDDAFHWHKLGNVEDNSIVDIWHGTRLRNFRLMHLDGRRAENDSCRHCDYMTALPDNIDPYLEELKGKI